MEVLILLGVLVILVPIAYGGFLLAPWVPTKKEDVLRTLDLLELQPESTVVDIGCGDGRFLIEAAKRGHRGIGYEIAWLPVLIGIVNARKAGVKGRVKLYIRNFLKSGLPTSDAIVFFLMNGKRGQRIARYIENNITQGTKVAAMVWPVPGWEDRLKKLDEPEGKAAIHIYQF